MSRFIRTISFQGIETRAVEVQAFIGDGLARFNVVGLPDKAIGESRERVRGALHAMGLSLPGGHIIVNLSPADLQKEGNHYDLAIALALLLGMEIIPVDAAVDNIVLGELALDGRILPVTGVLPGAMHAKSEGLGLICPQANGAEARWSGLDKILAPPTLLALINHWRGEPRLSAPPPPDILPPPPYPDMSDVRGQSAARRALEVAASGGHNLLMNGPPGSGKSMLAARLPGILPPLSGQELLENSMLASVAGLVNQGVISHRRPFRDPHHSCSMAALVGGGRYPRPGEISLAHNGVLFLDELPEAQRNVLDALRQPMENGQVTIARAEAHIRYPARFQLVAAMNPCRCGYLGDESRQCSRAPRCGAEYQSRLSGPLLDRIDIHLSVPAVTPQELQKAPTSEASAEIAKRVATARERQKKRYKNLANVSTNAQISGAALEEFCPLTDEAKTLLLAAMDKLQLSMRGYHRILRLARTLADMSGVDEIAKPHIAEAIAYREPVLLKRN